MRCPRCQHDNPEDTRFCGRCGRELPGAGETAVMDPADYVPPSRRLERGTLYAGRFEIIEEIGRGGMGTVYKVYDTKIREIVALKLLRPEIASDPEVVERFRNELKLARQVAHRHVCRMYDLGGEGTSVYITMEFVAGEDLKSFIRRSGHINEAKALDLARQILEGLAEAHRLGVVHRDLKPQNVMVDRDGNAKIMDFGIARSLHARGLTGTGIIIGTPEYMAPEQAEARDVDHRADIYSLGAILFEMVTGRTPFEGDTPLSIVLKHRTEPPADPQSLNAQVSAGLSRIILKCLEKSRERRYPSAAEILRDLAEVERSQPLTRKTLAPMAREAAAKPRSMKVPVAILFLAAAVVVALILSRPGPEAVRSQGPIRTEGRTPPTKLVPRPTAPDKGVPPDAKTAQGLEGTTAALGFKKASGAASAILGLLEPFAKDTTKLLDEKSAQELERSLDSIREKYPTEAAALSRYFDNIKSRIEQGRKERASGNLEASRRSFDRGESEMRKLLAEVSERERAEAAFAELQEAKRRLAPSTLRERPNLLVWIAGEKERDASDAFAKNDFSGARILCGLLVKIYGLSPKAKDETTALALLRDLSASCRKDAEAAGAPAKQAWLFDRAKGEDEEARRLVQEGLLPQAAERYILAAFLYEKAKEVALESVPNGRD